jgi:putative DNA primase/helicase
VGAEAVALAHNHALLVLDELKELASPDEASRLAYFFAHGQMKSRSNPNVKLRKSSSFTFDLIFLSTGEFGFIELIQRTDKRAWGGQEVRVLEIPAGCGKYGVFDDIHEFESPEKFAQYLTEASAQYFGSAAPAFVERYLEVGEDRVKAGLAAFMKEFTEQAIPANAQPELRRIAERFAFVAAAGELAIEWGIVPWPAGDAMSSARYAFKLLLQRRGTLGSADKHAALEHLRDYVRKYSDSRFKHHECGTVADEQQRILQLDGYLNDTGEGIEIQFANQIPRDVLGPYSRDLMMAALQGIHALVTDGRNRKVKRDLPGFPKGMRHVVILWDRLFESQAEPD